MFLLTLFSCGSEPAPAEDDGVTDLTVSLEAPSSGYRVVTDAFEVPPYAEVEICTVIRAEPHDDEVLGWFNRVETKSSEGSHHMNVMVSSMSFLDAFAGDGASAAALGMEEGQYPCAELQYMESMFPVFPSQLAHQEITMPEGVAAPLLVPALMVFSHHYVNPTERTLRVNAAINFHTVPSDTIEDVASLVFDDIGTLEIPPASQLTASRTCVMERDVELALVSTHTHQWGDCATLNHFDGEQVDAEPFFVNQLWETPPILHFYPGEYSLSAGEGVHYACHYRNLSDQTITNDGTADGEMCVFAGVVYPATMSVSDIEGIVASGDLSGLTQLMGEAIGPCDTHIEASSPWPLEDAALEASEPVCVDMEQTESNTLQ